MSSIEIKKRLVASLMQFLAEELKCDDLNAESKDSIEVALQCLETAYSINPVDGTLPSKKPILEIFKTYLETSSDETPKKVISEEDKAKAIVFKNEGNELLKNDKCQEALEAYAKAIQIDPTNPIFYCNRAYTHSKLGNHEAAIEDCKTAIKNDPNHSRAYSRMGVAYLKLQDYQRARDCYKKAVELDPSENNLDNLRFCEEKLREAESQMGSFENFANILGNPQFMSMTSQLMNNPNIQNMFSQLMGGAAAANAGQENANTETSGQPTGDSDTQDQPNNLNAFLQMGQQFAEMLKASNPELIEQLRKSMGNLNDGNNQNKEPDQNNS